MCFAIIPNVIHIKYDENNSINLCLPLDLCKPLKLDWFKFDGVAWCIKEHSNTHPRLAGLNFAVTDLS